QCLRIGRPPAGEIERRHRRGASLNQSSSTRRGSPQVSKPIRPQGKCQLTHGQPARRINPSHTVLPLYPGTPEVFQMATCGQTAARSGQPRLFRLSVSLASVTSPISKRKLASWADTSPSVPLAVIEASPAATRPKSATRLSGKDWLSAAFGAVVVAVLGAKRIQRSCPAGCTAEVGFRWWAACPP